MAQVSNLRSDNITTREATPIVQSAAGEGAPGRLIHVDGFLTTLATDSAHSIYSMVRVPSTAKLKRLLLSIPEIGAGAADVGLFYVAPGIQPGVTAARVYNTAGQAKSGVLDLDFFASAATLTGVKTDFDVSRESGTFTIDKRLQPLWAAAGLTKDPGGYFDIVIHVTTEWTNAVLCYLAAEYVD